MNLFLKSVSLIAALASTAGPAGDVVFNAMEDEMARSKDRLQLSGHEKPFYIEYTVSDNDSYMAMASFGAITSDGCSHARSLNSEVLLGDYKVNSGNSAMGFAGNPLMRIFSVFSHGQLGGRPISIDDNYYALRRALWHDTDAKYKNAIESFAAKKAYLVANKVVDRPDDLSKADPVVLFNSAGKLSVDRERWKQDLKESSQVFRNYPHVRKSMIAFAVGMENRWFLNSEGFKNRISNPTAMLFVVASGSREDGSKVGDTQFFVGDAPDSLPRGAELKKRVKEVADRVEALRTAKPISEDYDGPILFEGEAAAQFLCDTLAPQLGSPTESQGFAISRNQWREKLGLKVLPTFISIVDDPSAKEFAHIPIYGDRAVDDDGLRPEKLTLIDHGILKTFCMSRTPTRYLSKSNGHSVGGVGLPINLFLQADHPLSTSALRAKLIAEGKEQGLKYVYIVRRMGNLMSGIAGLGGDVPQTGDLAAQPPLLVYQVSVPDGHEELVRDVYFSHLTTRVLRDIEAAADDAKPYPAISASVANTFVTPSILIKEIELQKRQGKPTKNEPILQNPFFDHP